MEQSYTRLTREAVRRQHAGKRRYITGFDGIRTLAVLGVIIYHLAPSTLQGGVLRCSDFLRGFGLSDYIFTDSRVG